MINAFPRLIWRLRAITLSVAKRYLPPPIKDFLYKYVLPPTAFMVGNRRYIIASLDRKSFIDELERRGIRYAVLRWFERFPQWPDGEDMDVLIHPLDVANTNDLFQLLPNSAPVDLYTADGSKNLSYSGVSYFPNAFADKVLERAVLDVSGCRVPSGEDHFFSLAYHAVYHKCEDSGLASRQEYFSRISGEHDYEDALRALAERLDIKAVFTVEDLHELMVSRGVAPTLDTLRKLAVKRPNLRCLLPPEACDIRGGELLAIVVRDWAVEREFLELFKSEIEATLKFEILEMVPIASEARARALARIRGGNWGAGPNPRSGGGPAVLLLCFDFHPVPASDLTQSMHPFVKNENVIRAKNSLREFAHARTRFRDHANPVHTADDEIEALDYAETISPELAARARVRLENLRECYATRFPVRAMLPSFRRRAKVELIEFDGLPAVKKTFRPSARDYLAREIDFIQSLQGQCSWIPELLATGDCFFVLPYYENVLSKMSKSERNKAIKQRAGEVVDIFRFCYNHNYALMDFNPKNLIIEADGRLRLVDFEHIHHYRNRPPQFLDSFDIAGVPLLADGTLADGAYKESLSYAIAWRPILGPIGKYL